MKQEIKTIQLPEGKFNATVQIFESADDSLIRGIYKNWRALSEELRAFGGRGVNLPEVLSEAVFCRQYGTVRINQNISGANTSFDVYDLKRSKRIQIKACSVLPDLTSFGPDSVWDEIYFLDFYRKGKWDGTVDIYLIDNNLIYNHNVNAGQTMKHQQLQGRRPRFSIYKEIITRKGILPIKTYQI